MQPCLQRNPRSFAGWLAGMFGLFAAALISSYAFAQSSGNSNDKDRPWMNPQLSPDQRADMVVKEMSLDEKISMLHGTGMEGLSPLSPLIVHSNGGAGYVPAIPRLGIPAIQMSDAAYGVRSSGENGRYSTALPSDLDARSIAPGRCLPPPRHRP